MTEETKIWGPCLKGWRAEIGLLAPVPGMYREYDYVTPEGVRFAKAVLGNTGATPKSSRK